MAHPDAAVGTDGLAPSYDTSRPQISGARGVGPPRLPRRRVVTAAVVPPGFTGGGPAAGIDRLAGRRRAASRPSPTKTVAITAVNASLAVGRVRDTNPVPEPDRALPGVQVHWDRPVRPWPAPRRRRELPHRWDRHLDAEPHLSRRPPQPQHAPPSARRNRAPMPARSSSRGAARKNSTRPPQARSTHATSPSNTAAGPGRNQKRVAGRPARLARMQAVSRRERPTTAAAGRGAPFWRRHLRAPTTCTRRVPALPLGHRAAVARLPGRRARYPNSRPLCSRPERKRRRRQFRKGPSSSTRRDERRCR